MVCEVAYAERERERERDNVVKDWMLESHGGKADGSKLLLLMSLQFTKIDEDKIVANHSYQRKM